MSDKNDAILLAPNQSLARKMSILTPLLNSPTNLSNVRDFSKVCRTCATITEFVMPIFSGEGLQNDLAGKIKRHLPIQVQENDELPLVVCYQCSNTLLAWHELVKCSIQADAALRAKISSLRKTNPPNMTVNTSSSVEEEAQSKLFYISVRNALIDFHIDLDDDDTDVEFVCQKCVEKPALTTVHSLTEHIRHGHAPDTLDNAVKTFITNYITFEQVLVEDSDRGTQSDTKEKSQIVLQSLRCPFCSSVFSSATRLVYHLNKHVEVSMAAGAKCCDLVYSDKKLFAQHLQEAHVARTADDTVPVCVSCGFTASHGEEMRQHYIDAHNDVKSAKEKKVESPNNQKYIPAVCPECNKMFSNKYNMFAHMRSHTHTAVYPCDKCTRIYRNKGNLTHHKRLAHQGILNFICVECGEAFPSRSERDIHARIHSGETPYKCPHCGKSYRAKNTLTRHLEIHADVRKYECEICFKKFRKKSHLDYHVKTHMKLKPEISRPQPQQYRTCVYCASTHPVASFQKHLVVEHSHRLFHCEECDTFVDKKEFVVHMSFHALHFTAKGINRKKFKNKEDTVRQIPSTVPPTRAPQCPPKTRSPHCAPKTDNSQCLPITESPQCAPKTENSKCLPITQSSQCTPKTENPQASPKTQSQQCAPKTENPQASPKTESSQYAPKIESKPIIKTEGIKPPVVVKIKTSVQENEFSDHSDMDGFEPLPESVFEAIEDSQDGQQLADNTTHKPENRPHRDESKISSQPENNNLSTTGPSLEKKFKFNNCLVVIKPININNYAQMNIAIKNSKVNNNPANKTPPKTTDANTNHPTDEKEKRNQKTRKCPFCPKECRAASSYFYHLKYVHKKSKEHECEVCGRKFNTRSCLTQHMAIHTAQYEFECQQCPKQFKTKASLYIHEQTHNGKKLWSCSHCETSFRWKAQLQRHMTRHAAEKGHVCDTCGRGFSVRSDLLRHARTHTAGNFTCDKCGQKFAQLRYLKVHTTKQHSTNVRKGPK